MTNPKPGGRKTAEIAGCPEPGNVSIGDISMSICGSIVRKSALLVVAALVFQLPAQAQSPSQFSIQREYEKSFCSKEREEDQSSPTFDSRRFHSYLHKPRQPTHLRNPTRRPVSRSFRQQIKIRIPEDSRHSPGLYPKACYLRL